MKEAIRRTDNEKAKGPMETAVHEYQQNAADNRRRRIIDGG